MTTTIGPELAAQAGGQVTLGEEEQYHEQDPYNDWTLTLLTDTLLVQEQREAINERAKLESESEGWRHSIDEQDELLPTPLDIADAKVWKAERRLQIHERLTDSYSRTLAKYGLNVLNSRPDEAPQFALRVVSNDLTGEDVVNGLQLREYYGRKYGGNSSEITPDSAMQEGHNGDYRFTLQMVTVGHLKDGDYGVIAGSELDLALFDGPDGTQDAILGFNSSACVEYAHSRLAQSLNLMPATAGQAGQEPQAAA